MSNFMERSFAAAKRTVGPEIQEPGTSVLSDHEAGLAGLGGKAGQKTGVVFEDLTPKAQKIVNEARLKAFPPVE